MVKELGVTLSMEWHCAQFACANALPAGTLEPALHRVGATNTFSTIITDEKKLTFHAAVQIL